jgi:hypothetical protein
MAMPESPTTAAPTDGSESTAEALWEEQRSTVHRGVSVGAIGAAPNPTPHIGFVWCVVSPPPSWNARGAGRHLEELDGLDQDHRLPAAIIHQMLDAVVQMTGDPTSPRVRSRAARVTAECSNARSAPPPRSATPLRPRHATPRS